MKGKTTITIEQLGEKAQINLSPEGDNINLKVDFGGKQLKELKHTDIEGMLVSILELIKG